MYGSVDITSAEFSYGKTTKQIRNLLFSTEQCKAIAAVKAGQDISEVCEDWDVTSEWLEWAMS